jgi:acyl-CoA synthetase (AMP-forming)/AMP-acid ligase II
VLRYLSKGNVLGDNPEWTFAQLYTKSLSVAAQLQQEGLHGEPVILLFPAGLEFTAAFYGALLAQSLAIPVPMPNPRSRAPLRQLLQTAKAAKATTILTDAATVAMAQSFAGQLPPELRWLAINTDTAGVTDSFGAVTGDQIAYLQFTSGSTGNPKGVMISHDNILANLRVQEEVSLTDPSVKAIVWAPHYHDLCLVGHILGPVYQGFESTIMSPMDYLYRPVRWLHAVSHFGLTHSASPNFGYQIAAQRITATQCEELKIDLSSWIVAGNGGEPVSADTIRLFTEAFAPFGFRSSSFLPTLGMAESVLFVSAKKPADEAPQVLTLHGEAMESNRVELVTAHTNARVHEIVSCGGISSEHRMRVVNPETLQPCGRSEIGELWLQGPSVAMGYYNQPEASLETFGATLPGETGTFLRTGDLGFIHDDAIYLTGRFKDLIIIGGKNHYPNDLEKTAIHATPAIRPGSCAAFSVLSGGQEHVVLVAELRGKIAAQAEARGVLDDLYTGVSSAIRGAVTKGHGIALHNVVLVKERSLQKTSSGKVMRRFYRTLFAADKLAVLHNAEFRTG